MLTGLVEEKTVLSVQGSFTPFRMTRLKVAGERFGRLGRIEYRGFPLFIRNDSKSKGKAGGWDRTQDGDLRYGSTAGGLSAMLVEA